MVMLMVAFSILSVTGGALLTRADDDPTPTAEPAVEPVAEPADEDESPVQEPALDEKSDEQKVEDKDPVASDTVKHYGFKAFVIGSTSKLAELRQAVNDFMKDPKNNVGEPTVAISFKTSAILLTLRYAVSEKADCTYRLSFCYCETTTSKSDREHLESTMLVALNSPGCTPLGSGQEMDNDRVLAWTLVAKKK